LQRVLDHYLSREWRAERVLITGDLIQDGSSAAYDRFRDILLPLKLRMHCVPGNHDVRELMRAVCVRPPFSYCAQEKVRNWLFVGLDSCLKDEAGGEVADAELQRLEDIVDASDAAHVAVYLHHPPIELGSAWLDTVRMRNGDKVLHRLQALGKIRLLLFGHVHQPYDQEHFGIRVVGTPSTCRQFMPHSDEFAVDECPPAYRRLVFRNDGSTDMELIWVNE
jgi:Icc protein